MNTIAVETQGLRPGDVVLTESNTTESPFRFAFFHDRAYRQATKDAGRPDRYTVVSMGRVPDEPSDLAVTFDLGAGVSFTLDFHHESTFTTVVSA